MCFQRAAQVPHYPRLVTSSGSIGELFIKNKGGIFLSFHVGVNGISLFFPGGMGEDFLVHILQAELSSASAADRFSVASRGSARF